MNNTSQPCISSHTPYHALDTTLRQPLRTDQQFGVVQRHVRYDGPPKPILWFVA
jgi:hypothetical protein